MTLAIHSCQTELKDSWKDTYEVLARIQLARNLCNKKPVKSLFRRAWQYRGSYAIGLVYLALTNITTMAIPQLVRFIIDGISAQAPIATMQSIAVTMILVACGGAVFRTQSRVYLLRTARDIEMDLRSDFYARLTRLSPSFYHARSTGDLMSRATNDLSQLRLLLGPGFLNVVNTAVAFATALPLMLAISVELTLWSLATFPPAAYLVRRMTRIMYRRIREQQEVLGAFSGFIRENLAGAHVLRAFAQEEHRHESFSELNARYMTTNIRLAFVRSIMWRFMMVLGSTGPLIVITLGARRVMDGVLTLGEVIALIEYLAILTWPVFALGWVFSMWQRGAASMVRINEVLLADLDIAEGSVHASNIEPTITIEDLTVSIDDQSVLQNVSIDIPKGTTLGIVGGIGSGKTTILRAIMRLLEVPSERIRVGGHDIGTLSFDSLRSTIGYVPQDHLLFSRSLRDNVAFGKPDATDQEITDVLHAAALHPDDPSIPHGLDTEVGERGFTLSGGQNQRTSLARALLIDPPILLLDDVLSAVDAETEEKILGALRQIRSDKTTVIVSHRFSSVEHADSIVVLEDGRIAEQGTHKDLMQTSVSYRRMVERQQLEAAVSGDTLQRQAV